MADQQTPFAAFDESVKAKSQSEGWAHVRSISTGWFADAVEAAAEAALRSELPPCPSCGCALPSDPDQRECGCDAGCNDGPHAPGVNALVTGYKKALERFERLEATAQAKAVEAAVAAERERADEAVALARTILGRHYDWLPHAEIYGKQLDEFDVALDLLGSEK